MSPAVRSLTAGEQAALAAMATPPSRPSPVPYRRGADARAAMAASAVRWDAAAPLIGVPPQLVRDCVGVCTGFGVELLGWFDERDVCWVHGFQLPSVGGGEPSTWEGRVVHRALPKGMDALAVACWWDAPNAGLCDDAGLERTPRDWLRATGQLGRLLAVAADEGRD